MHGLYPWHCQQRLSDIRGVDTGGRGLHEPGQDVQNNWTGGPEHNGAAYERGDGIRHGVAGLDVDHNRGN